VCPRMGKASSSKKVARAARAGSSTKGTERRALGFPLAIAVTVLLGTSLVLYARGNRSDAIEPRVGDHWHAAYGIWNCDEFMAPLSDAGPDLTGIHTHGDGVMHIHPFNSGAAGSRATTGKFFETTGVSVGNDRIELPDGTVLDEEAGCDGEGARLELARWPADDADADPEIFTSDFDEVSFREDREVIVIGLVKEGEELPRPDTVPTLDNLSDVIEAPGATTTTVAGDGDEGDTTTTTVAGDTSTTTSVAPTTTAG
jgi:hypothetical protein